MAGTSARAGSGKPSRFVAGEQALACAAPLPARGGHGLPCWARRANLAGPGGRRQRPWGGPHLEHCEPSPLVAWQRGSPLSVCASSPPAMAAVPAGEQVGPEWQVVSRPAAPAWRRRSAAAAASGGALAAPCCLLWTSAAAVGLPQAPGRPTGVSEGVGGSGRWPRGALSPALPRQPGWPLQPHALPRPRCGRAPAGPGRAPGRPTASPAAPPALDGSPAVLYLGVRRGSGREAGEARGDRGGCGGAGALVAAWAAPAMPSGDGCAFMASPWRWVFYFVSIWSVM